MGPSLRAIDLLCGNTVPALSQDDKSERALLDDERNVAHAKSHSLSDGTPTFPSLRVLKWS